MAARWEGMFQARGRGDGRAMPWPLGVPVWAFVGMGLEEWVGVSQSVRVAARSCSSNS